MRYTNEIKVGVVFLGGLFLIIFGYFYLRGVGLGADLYYVRLNGAAQIAQGNDVRLQGVKIGQVQDVGFDPKTQQPILTLAVRRSRPPFKLLTTYRYSVQNSGLVGENYVDIRGPYNSSQPIYLPNKTGQFIPGQAASGLLSVTTSAEDVVKSFRQTLGKLNETLERINKGVLNQTNQQKLTRTLENTAVLTGNASRAIENAVGPNGVKVGFGDPNSQKSLNETLRNIQIASASASRSAGNIEAVTRRAGGITDQLTGEGRGILRDARGNLNSLFNENRAQFRALLGNLDNTAKNVAGITETLDFTLKNGGFKDNAQVAFQSLRRAAENIEIATGSLRKFGEDPTTTDNISKTITALRESSEALRDTAQTVKGFVAGDANTKINGLFVSLNATAQNLETTTAGLAKIAGDPTLAGNVTGAAANLNSTLEATKSAAERFNALLGGRRPAPVKGTQAPSGPATPEGAKNAADEASAFRASGISFTARRFLDERRGDDGRNFGDLGFETELAGAPFRLGLDNIGEENDVTLQSGMFLRPDFAARFGLYRSKLGAGVELRRGKFSLEANLYDPNHVSYNVYGGFRLSPRVQIIAGREGVRGDEVTSVGVRVSQ